MAAGLSVFLGCEGLCCTLTASQRLQLSAEVLTRLFLSSLMGSGNSPRSSTPISAQWSGSPAPRGWPPWHWFQSQECCFAVAPGLDPLCGHLSGFKVHLISQHNKGEVFRIPGTGLDGKLLSPALRGFERVGGSLYLCRRLRQETGTAPVPCPRSASQLPVITIPSLARKSASIVAS